MSLRMLWKLDKEFARRVGRIQWEVYSKPRWITKWYHKGWWTVVPGVEIKVKWPAGPVIKTFEDQYKSDDELFSTDPNDHYRPWLTKNVGRQTWDWDWELRDNDVADNTLTIKFRHSKSRWATIAALKWS
jgi:hypothetical protein